MVQSITLAAEACTCCFGLFQSKYNSIYRLQGKRKLRIDFNDYWIFNSLRQLSEIKTGMTEYKVFSNRFVLFKAMDCFTLQGVGGEVEKCILGIREHLFTDKCSSDRVWRDLRCLLSSSSNPYFTDKESEVERWEIMYSILWNKWIKENLNSLLHAVGPGNFCITVCFLYSLAENFSFFPSVPSFLLPLFPPFLSLSNSLPPSFLFSPPLSPLLFHSPPFFDPRIHLSI